MKITFAKIFRIVSWLAICAGLTPLSGLQKEATGQETDGDPIVIQVADPSLADLSLEKETLLRFSAQPDSGFHFPFYLRIPENIKRQESFHLLVEPNNSGFADDEFAKHEQSAEKLTGNYPWKIASELNVPLLVPVFPRPMSNWRAYTHSLDEDTLLIEDGNLQRIDLQLLAMIDLAQQVLKQNDVGVESQVFMHGFSASGTFTNRFAMIHPKRVRAVASGGVNAIPTLPVRELENEQLHFPIGIADLGKLTGNDFDLDAYRHVSQFIYMGAHDRNDTTKFGDAYNEGDAAKIHALVGKRMPERWKRCREIYREQNVSAQMVTYESTSHEIRPEMLEDIVSFFASNSQKEHKTITPHEYPVTELQRHENVTVNGLYWRGDERIPDFARDLFGGKGSFIICIEERFPGQGPQQFNDFRSDAGFEFRLEAEGHDPIQIKAGHSIGTCSGPDNFQGFVAALGKEVEATMIPGVEYKLVSGNATRWLVGDHIRLVKPEK